MSLNPLAQNVQAPRRALRRVALLDVDARGCLFPRLTWQPLNLNVCWSGERYLAAATLRPPIPVPEKRWKPQPIISKYLGVPKHCLHFGYEGSNQSLLRKLHKHFGAASSLRAACQSCKKVRAISKSHAAPRTKVACCASTLKARRGSSFLIVPCYETQYTDGLKLDGPRPQTAGSFNPEVVCQRCSFFTVLERQRNCHCGLVVEFIEAISAQAARTHVITKGSSELPEFSQLQLGDQQ